MNKIKYSILFIGIIISSVSAILIILEILNKPNSLIFYLGIILMMIGLVMPTQLCEGLP